VPATAFFFAGDLDYGPVKAELAKLKPVGARLGDLVDEYDELRGPFVASALEPVTRAFAEKNGLTTKELFMLLRLITTGRSASPLFETMEVLGKEITRRRMRQGTEFLKTLK